MQQEFPPPISYVEQGCSQFEFHFQKLKISRQKPENHGRQFLKKNLIMQKKKMESAKKCAQLDS